MTDIDLSVPRSVHVVGIGGAGMSAIAAVLAWMGHHVTGSDLKASPGLDRLRLLGIEVFLGHDPSNVGDVDFVAISSAIPEHNSEVRAAGERSIVVCRRAEVLAAISAQRRTIAVAGTHGKTTTSSMLALVLADAGFEPSFIIGGDVNEIGSGAVWGEGEYFVVEADESDGTFVTLGHEVGVVTNLEPDHLETYGGFDGLVAAFESFVSDATGPVIICADDPGAARLADLGGTVSYGQAEGCDYRIVGLQRGADGIAFDLVSGTKRLGSIDLPLPGLHNALNAAGAAATALEIGADPTLVCASLSRFGGVARRFEQRGSAAGVTFVDDYAHLPTEVTAAIAAAADGNWNRIVCVFQPHRYSRTESLWQEFATSFEGADHIVVTDVYSAGEPLRPGVTGQLIVDAVRSSDANATIEFIAHRAPLIDRLTDILQPGDLCLTLGAGDLTTVPTDLIAGLQ
ncbi:MAG: UDP-N-acetylmuramate--L-alanine ligase [Acidobacteria bacterium]|nr:UDP-N-acetylmuramate--L-alanine ligase [Acidobacteriota bacterium]